MKFDRLAPHYDWMETWLAGERLQRTRTAWLDELRLAVGKLMRFGPRPQCFPERGADR